MTAQEFRERVKQAQAEVKHYGKLRNFWRAVVRKRIRQAKEAAERRKAKSKPHVTGSNQVRGGKPRERLLYLCQVAVKEFRPYYSEAGTWCKVPWAIRNVVNDRFRSDCSSWFMNAYRACGLAKYLNGADYDNSGGNTTSLAEKGKEVDRHYAETHAGVAVIFYEGGLEPSNSVHAGMSDGTGPNGYQHGQEPLEHTLGMFDEFGVGNTRYFDFLSR